MSAGQLLVCKLCKHTFKAITNTHLKTKHGMTLDEYRELFPGDVLRDTSHLAEWRNSAENAEHLRRNNAMVYADVSIRERKAQSVRDAWSDAALRQAQSERMKALVAEHPDRFPQLFVGKEGVTDWMRLSNHERWVVRYGSEEADRRLADWNMRNVLPSCSRDTKPEKRMKALLEELGLLYEHQYAGVKGYRCDFYVRSHDLVIEVDGDYWHANPRRFSANDVIGAKQQTASEIWAIDARKNSVVTAAGHKLLRYWWSDLKLMSSAQVAEDVVHATGKPVG